LSSSAFCFHGRVLEGRPRWHAGRVVEIRRYPASPRGRCGGSCGKTTRLGNKRADVRSSGNEHSVKYRVSQLQQNKPWRTSPPKDHGEQARAPLSAASRLRYTGTGSSARPYLSGPATGSPRPLDLSTPETARAGTQGTSPWLAKCNYQKNQLTDDCKPGRDDPKIPVLIRSLALSYFFAVVRIAYGTVPIIQASQTFDDDDHQPYRDEPPSNRRPCGLEPGETRPPRPPQVSASVRFL